MTRLKAKSFPQNTIIILFAVLATLITFLYFGLLFVNQLLLLLYGASHQNDFTTFRLPSGYAAVDKVKLWDNDIIFNELKPIDLRFHQGIRCKGKTCPRLVLCHGNVPKPSTNISACWNEKYQDPIVIKTAVPANYEGSNKTFDVAEGDPFAGQLFVLNDVFVNDRGSVFDRKNIYIHAQFCKSAPVAFGRYIKNGTTVHRFEELATIAYWNGPNFYHALLETMPALFLLRPVLRNRPGIPVAYRSLQDHFFNLFALIDLPPQKVNFHRIRDGQLFFARRLVVPSQARCGRPSASIVRSIRQDALNLRTDCENQKLPPDWIIVIGERAKTRRPTDWEKLLEALKSLIPKNRTYIYGGNLPVEEAKKLFSKCRLYIAPHGAALANILFMPCFGEVVEIRPTGFDNNVYHYLAHICRIKYNLIHGNGTKDTEIIVNHEKVLLIVKNIMRSFNG